jgi:hypothetical protein
MDLVGINCFNLKEFINNPIKKNIKEVGRWMQCMEEESWSIKMGKNTLESN